jgi:ParB/RepB/Spo0J family partition protein
MAAPRGTRRRRSPALTEDQADQIHALHTALGQAGIEAPPPPRGEIHLAQMLALDQLAPSPINPRRHFDDERLKALADSVRLHGVLEPLIVRPGDTVWEIVAGERRFRAAQLAGLDQVPVIARPLTDEQVLEFSLIENLHRDDLAPLELARGFRRLITTNPTKHSAESIATRMGMSATWVWDRLKLLDLVPEAQAILDEERMSIGHAILIARLKPADQQRVIAHDDASSTAHREVGLWRPDHGFTFEAHGNGRTPGKYDGLKPCSIRELEAWIDDHIRFDVAHAAQAQPLTFEPLAEQVLERRAQPSRGKKVIAITLDHHVGADARDDERTYGSGAWKFADGEEHTQAYPRKTYTAATCEHAVLGVVVAGARRGASFEVCIARDKCLVHWKKEIAEREKTATARASGKESATAKAAARREQKAAEYQRLREQRWKHFSAALKTAVVAAAEKLPAKLPPALYERMLQDHGVPKKTIVADLPKALLLQSIGQHFKWMSEFDESSYVAWAKALGVNVKACEPPAVAKVR